MTTEERISLLRYQTDQIPHITIDKEICSTCKERYCSAVCPAGCYEIQDGEIFFSHLACLECGTCYIACEREAIQWGYPRGGYGVCFRLV